MTGYVYFIRPVGMLGPVKIGSTAWPKRRLVDLFRWSPVKLEIAAMIPGGIKLETNIHQCLRDHHSHGEWFNASDMVVSLVAKLASGIPIEEALDLTKRIGPLPRNSSGRSAWTDERRRGASLQARIRIANTKAFKRCGKVSAAQDADMDVICASIDDLLVMNPARIEGVLDRLNKVGSQ